jgi:hypothetical protein
MNHTAEPWRVGKGYGAVVADAKVRDGPIGADDVHSYGGYLICESTTKDNARRIIACVNACAGLTEQEIKLAVKVWKTKRRNIVL